MPLGRNLKNELTESIPKLRMRDVKIINMFGERKQKIPAFDMSIAGVLQS
jgi:hypothetical protein